MRRRVDSRIEIKDGSKRVKGQKKDCLKKA